LSSAEQRKKKSDWVFLSMKDASGKSYDTPEEKVAANVLPGFEEVSAFATHAQEKPCLESGSERIRFPVAATGFRFSSVSRGW